MKSRSKKTLGNILANLTGRVWLVLANLLMVPIYIEYLGNEQYGLITFYVTLQTVINLIGLGLSKTLRREFSHEDDNLESNKIKYKTLRSTETVYFLLIIIAISIVILLSDSITNGWLNLEFLSFNYVSNTIKVMAISIGAQLLANLYLGCYYGMQKQVFANSLQALTITVKYLLAIVLFQFSLSLIHLYILFSITDIVFIFIMRFRLVYLLKLKKLSKKWVLKDLSILRKNISYSLGLMLISIGYSINTQVDKIIVSKYFNLTTLGAYNTVFYLGSGLTLLVSAVGIAIFPQLTNLYKNNLIDEQKKLFLKSNLIFTILLSTLGVYIALYSYEIITIWTQDKEIMDILGYTPILILLGSTFLSLQELPYEFLLSMGITRYNNFLTIISIIYTIIIMPILVAQMGILGGGISWVLLMTVSTSIYLILVFKKYFWNWKYILYKTYFFPLITSFTLAIISKILVSVFIDNTYLIVVFGILFGTVNIAIFYLYYRKFLSDNEINSNKKGVIKYYG